MYTFALPLERALATAPGSCAVVCQDNRRTYAELGTRCRHLAGALRALGLTPGDRVGVIGLNSDRYLEGYLYLVDRAKDMIVSGGENIYSTEVEDALASHPAVEEVAVFGVPDPRWGESVYAVVSVRQPVTAEELAAHCRQRIAGFKVPRHVELLAEPLPKSAAGKILKRELREPHWAGQQTYVSGS